ncbi:hypothetical protein G4B88_010060 [Cannabis sativa]|uniref:RNase H type-1 domain-containing protein n=1 Tax=Cannabis sativa TaxID=3483 RepID=A0A7J6E7V2_CANSA|nr:hypothetical protein G4B88_010060 [Cannabis sativa]
MNTIHSTDITGYHVFQVDASVADGSAGIAAVYKSDSNDADDFLAIDHLRVENVLQGELAAISLALSTAKQLGMERVAIQSDCKTAVTTTVPTAKSLELSIFRAAVLRRSRTEQNEHCLSCRSSPKSNRAEREGSNRAEREGETEIDFRVDTEIDFRLRAAVLRRSRTKGNVEQFRVDTAAL